MSVDALQILHEVKAMGPSSLSELSQELGLARKRIKASAGRLVEVGLLEMRGSGRSRRFHLAAAFYRLAEDKNAYVRLRELDPIQQHQMVMSFVDSFGSISRGQVAELCHLTSSQARTVLQRLTAAGELIMSGQKRGARYSRPR